MKHVYSGKVRDIYDAGDDRLLMVASDRVSAFDVVMAEPIPNKGRVLTGMTAFWLDLLKDVAPNHLVTVDPAEFPDNDVADAAGRDVGPGRDRHGGQRDAQLGEALARGGHGISPVPGA